MVGTLLLVFAKQDLVPFISDIRGTVTPIGVMGVMGNKGSATIRMRLHSTTLCFVCAHLRPSRTDVAGRNSDVQSIVEKTSLPPQSSTSSTRTNGTSTASSPNTSDSSPSEPSANNGDDFAAPKSACSEWNNDFNDALSIHDHDHVFWLGDLNYRIDCSYSTEDIFSLLQQGKYRTLWRRDQLCIEREAGAVFVDYEEGDIDFLPTYKYQPKTTVYEQRPEKKLRAPAWCDRILWRSAYNPDAVRQLSYRRTELITSDHRPVSAQFNFDALAVDADREKAMFLELLAMSDKWENASIPKVAVENRFVDFGVMPQYVSVLPA